jgi:hypothetical protein
MQEVLHFKLAFGHIVNKANFVTFTLAMTRMIRTGDVQAELSWQDLQGSVNKTIKLI